MAHVLSSAGQGRLIDQWLEECVGELIQQKRAPAMGSASRLPTRRRLAGGPLLSGFHQ